MRARATARTKLARKRSSGSADEDASSSGVERGRLERLSDVVSSWAGGSSAFAVALLVVATWGLTGPIFGYSDTWQLVINTGTTIVTFLMVFLIQRSQNKESLAVQLKLNEIVAALEGASNRLIDIEQLGESDLGVLREHYRHLVVLAKRDDAAMDRFARYARVPGGTRVSISAR